LPPRFPAASAYLSPSFGRGGTSAVIRELHPDHPMKEMDFYLGTKGPVSYGYLFDRNPLTVKHIQFHMHPLW
jgi:hypothetical protein